MADILYHLIPKLIVSFLLMMVYIHLSGKGALAPISTIDQIGNVALGAIIGGSLYNREVHVLLLLAAGGLWAALLLGVRYLSNRKHRIKDLVDGEAIPLIRKGKILSENFDHAKLSIRDFVMLLHQRGYQNLEDLQEVWYEYNGQLTVICKGDEATATTLVENGEVNTHNLTRLDRTEEWLVKELKKEKIKLEEVFYAEWHSSKLWIYPIHQPETPEQ